MDQFLILGVYWILKCFPPKKILNVRRKWRGGLFISLFLQNSTLYKLDKRKDLEFAPLLSILPFPIVLFLCFLLFTLIWFFISREERYSKNSSFERGFDSKNLRVSFSNQYYLVAVLFLIFDLEIVLTFPIPLSIPKGTLLGGVFFLFFTIILLYEWKFGLLDWVK